jgi:hypothetical protein
MNFVVTIPEDLLARLRAGAFDFLLVHILESDGRAFEDVLYPRMERVCALLDQIGWQAGDAGEEVVIDIFEHAAALYDALSFALGEARRDLREAEGRRVCAGEGRAGLRGRLADLLARSTTARHRARECSSV